MKVKTTTIIAGNEPINPYIRVDYLKKRDLLQKIKHEDKMNLMKQL